MTIVLLARNLAWLIFLFYSPFILLRMHNNLSQIALEIVLIITYSIFLAIVLNQRKENNIHASRFHQWLSKKKNVKALTRTSIATLRSALCHSSTCSMITASVIAIPLFSLPTQMWMLFITLAFSCAWTYALIVSVINIYNGSHPEKHPQSNALQSPKFEVSRYLNAVVVNDPSYLFHLFKKAGDGYTHNNIVFPDKAETALKLTSYYCALHHVPLHLVNMKHPRHFNTQQKESILSKAKAHERYEIIFDHTQKIDDILNSHMPYSDAAFDILDYITRHPMYEARQNILIIQHYYNDQCPEWLYEFIDDVTSLNRFCYGSVLFIDSSFNQLN